MGQWEPPVESQASAPILPLDRLEPGPQRELGEYLASLAQKALEEQSPRYGRFMDEEERRVARLLFGGQEEVALRFYGGYRQARRQRPALAARWAIEEPTVTGAVAALWFRPAKEGTLQEAGDMPPERGDRLAAGLLALLDIPPEDTGDVMATREGGLQAVVSRERIEGIAFPHTVRFQGREWVVEPIDFERLDVPPERIKDVRTTVASLRLDAVAGSGFGVSRSKMAAEIKAGRVRVNWQVVDSPSRPVKPGDIIAVPGRGKVIVGEVGAPSRKGRIPVSLQLQR